MNCDKCSGQFDFIKAGDPCPACEPTATPIVSVKLHRLTSVFSIVHEAEEIIRTLPHKYYSFNGESIDNVYVAGALTYDCRIMTNPWSKNYPTREEIVATIRHRALIEVILYEPVEESVRHDG